MNTAPTLTFRQLGCSKGGRKLFQGVNCSLDAGRWLYIVGANGVGKTSLLRMLCGLAPIEEGDIHWNGIPISKQADAYRQDLCYLGHLNGLQEALTVNENIVFAAALGGRAIDPREVPELLAEFGVGGRGSQLVKHLSQGQKRRVALIRLALSPARLWVLDEPFVAMDESGIRMLADLLAKHLRNAGSVVLTSHQTVDIGGIAAQVLDLSA